MSERAAGETIKKSPKDTKSRPSSSNASADGADLGRFSSGYSMMSGRHNDASAAHRSTSGMSERAAVQTIEKSPKDMESRPSSSKAPVDGEDVGRFPDGSSCLDWAKSMNDNPCSELLDDKRPSLWSQSIEMRKSQPGSGRESFITPNIQMTPLTWENVDLDALCSQELLDEELDDGSGLQDNAKEHGVFRSLHDFAAFRQAPLRLRQDASSLVGDRRPDCDLASTAVPARSQAHASSMIDANNGGY
eukprot:TRINITY_DN52362_c0_g1_i1.p1 TRINITY_DN52362_c0_g1~~TRINITY_DN52362_c0_g1_i1.p1  ORF type:complete len:257 (+),score=50.38 TRINITY_DN52362_c0_g1_i1:33-773(+)